MSVDNSILQGECTCKKIKYRLLQRPLFVHCCHCRWCQRETGSAFVLNALIERANVEVVVSDSSLQIVDTPSDSGRGQSIIRCSNCFVALWSHYGQERDLTYVRVGTLNEPSEVIPDVHIYTTSKQPWLILGNDVPKFDASYDFFTTWPKESIMRIQQVMSGAASDGN